VTYQVQANFSSGAQAGSYQFSITGAAGNNGQAVLFSPLPLSGATITIVMPTFTPTATLTSTLTAPPTSTPSPVPTLIPTVSPTKTATPSGNPVLFPNPAPGGGSATLQVNLAAPGNVRIQVFTVSFRKVLDKTVPNIPAGVQDLTFPLVDKDGTALADGLYYVVVTANGKRWILKLLILG
jgi:hypothetical protein